MEIGAQSPNASSAERAAVRAEEWTRADSASPCWTAELAYLYCASIDWSRKVNFSQKWSKCIIKKLARVENQKTRKRWKVNTEVNLRSTEGQHTWKRKFIISGRVPVREERRAFLDCPKVDDFFWWENQIVRTSKDRKYNLNTSEIFIMHRDIFSQESKEQRSHFSL